MTLHLLKPALKATDVFEFQKRQKRWHTYHRGQCVYPVWTSRRPARSDELLNGGSVFWIIRKMIQCRQSIIGIEQIQEGDEKPSYLIFCEPDLVRTRAIEKRPFQGWRYLEASNAPGDIGAIDSGGEEPPEHLGEILREAGLL